ncbi:MAG TPA: hypothetical protein VGF40_04200, partial [Thermoanaerobaculia bacterium]
MFSAIAIVALLAAALLRYLGAADASFPLALGACASAAVAIAAARGRPIRILAAGILVAAAIDGAAAIEIGRIRSDWDGRSAARLDEGAANLRAWLRGVESDLQADLGAVGSALSANPDAGRLEMFELLEAHSGDPDRGFRIMDPAGRPVAWWGEELPGVDGRRWRFDVTNLYVNRRATVRNGDLVIDHYQRVPNFASERLRDAAGSAFESARLHAGALALAPAARRFTIARSGPLTLQADLVPRSPEDVARTLARRSGTVAAIAIAAALILALAAAGRLRPDGAGGDATAIAAIVLARAALLGVQPPSDPASIFGFAIYASRILGPFTRSPFDLLLTALALLVIGHLAMRRRGGAWRPAVTIAQGALVVGAAYGIVRVIENLVSNSRISPVPQHVVPASPAQAVLLASLLFLGLAAIQATR